MAEKQTQILVLGAGYAGMMAAIRLAGKTKKQNGSVTLINAGDHFVERPRLHEVATGNLPQQQPLAEMIKGTGIHFRQGYVTSIDPKEQLVALQTAGTAEQADERIAHFPYDYLIYALGSQVDRDSVPGVREYAYALDAAGPLTAEPLNERLEALAAQGGRVAVVGSGPTGIEAAAEIADLYPNLQVMMVTHGEFGAFKNERVQSIMRRAMTRLKVQIVEHAGVTEVQASELIINGQEPIPFDLCIWAGGFRALSLAREVGLQVNQRDQILVDPYQRSLSHPTIYAIGDAAYSVQQPGAPMRMALFPALVTGAHAADNISRCLEGKEQRLLGFSYYGQGIALGRRDAVGFAAFPDDQPIGPILTGRLGLTVRNFFVSLIPFMLTVERRLPGFFFWLGRNRGQEPAIQAVAAPTQARQTQWP